MAAPADPAILVPAGGLLIGAVFGAVAARTNFCTMGAVSDIVNIGDWNRMRMWLLAIAVAILGSQALQFGGMIDLGKSIYTAPRLNWLSIVAGGLTLGVMQQVIRAFGRVENSFQYLVRSWTTIVSLISVYKRLRAFEATLQDQPLDLIEAEAAGVPRA